MTNLTHHASITALPAAPHGKFLWVYDCEVFSNHLLVLMTDGSEWKSFDETSIPALISFVSNSAIALAGFNNHAFDDNILVFLVEHPSATTADVHALVQRLIHPAGDRDEALNQALQFRDRPWAYSIDVYAMLPGFGSLKELACREGFPNVVESPVDFAKPVADHERAAVAHYCRTDVLVTTHLLRHHWGLVTVRTTLLEYFQLGWRAYHLSEAQLAQHTLLTLQRQRTGRSAGQLRAAAQANPANAQKSFRVSDLLSTRIRFTTPPFQELLARLRDGTVNVERGGSLRLPGLDASSLVSLAGTSFAIGIGGLHSVDTPGILTADDQTALIDLDVTSYYPAIIINEGLFPTHLGPSFVHDLTQLRDQRVAAKRAGDSVTATALKIVINSAYGKLNDQWSPLRSVPDAYRVTLNGQCFLLMLIERLSVAGAKILSANTDGVTIQWTPSAVATDLPALLAAWSTDTGMELERTDFARLCRRDVNSYLALTTSGTVKSKGAYNPDTGKGDGQIIKQAAEAWLLRGIDPAHAIDTAVDVTSFLFYQRAKNGGVLCHGESDIGGILRWYASLTGAPIRRRNPSGTWTTIPHGHAATLAMDISDWTRADLIDLDRQHYIDEAWKLIREVTPPAAQHQQLTWW